MAVRVFDGYAGLAHRRTTFVAVRAVRDRERERVSIRGFTAGCSVHVGCARMACPYG